MFGVVCFQYVQRFKVDDGVEACILNLFSRFGEFCSYDKGS